MKSIVRKYRYLSLFLVSISCSHLAYGHKSTNAFTGNSNSRVFNYLAGSLQQNFSDTMHWSSALVFYGKGGKLEYAADSLGNTIPDFSHVGYHYGDIPIPEVPVVLEVSPVEGDDYINIQSAINTISAMPLNENGFRGTLLLKKGEYQVAGSIYLQTDGVVLRGEGNSEEGTVIVATGTGQRPLIDVGLDKNLSVDQGTKTKIKENYVPVGRKYILVENPEFFAQSDEIALYRPGTQNWISDLKMDKIPYKDGLVQWTPESYSFYFERVVTKVSGDTLFFRNPIVMAFDEKYGGGYVFKASMPRFRHIGVENILLKSEYAFDTDNAHAMYGVLFRNAEHSWARDVVSKYFSYSCVSVGWDAKHISVLNSKCLDPKSVIDGGWRYSFNIEGQLSLIKNCFTSNGRHDYVTSARVCGPNVFTQSTAEYAWNDAGPHHRWAMGTLFDSIVTSSAIDVQDRGNSGTGHGWAGVNQVFWNCKATSSICQSPWVSGKNFNIGFQGYKDKGWAIDRPDGEWEGQNMKGLFPSSLYNAQLADRLTDEKYFSLISLLEQLTDSTFLLKFNLPVDPLIAMDKSMYVISGTAEVQNLDWDISLSTENNVLFTFHELPILKNDVTISIDAKNVLSKEGLPLSIISVASYKEPDKRPVVYFSFQRVTNASGVFVTASSSKTGRMYLIKQGLTILSQQDLENAVLAGNALSADVAEPLVSIKIYTTGLPKGKYFFYACDEQGRISRELTTFIYVDAVISVGTLNQMEEIGVVAVNRSLNIFSNESGFDPFTVEVYTIQGRLIYKGLCSDRLKISVPESGIYIVHCVKEQNADFRKVAIP